MGGDICQVSLMCNSVGRMGFDCTSCEGVWGGCKCILCRCVFKSVWNDFVFNVQGYEFDMAWLSRWHDLLGIMF